MKDTDLLDGILNHNTDAIEYLYSHVYPSIEAFVLKNNGNTVEARDVFQEGIIAFYQNIATGKYRLEQSTKPTSYLFQICKFQWYSVLRSAHKKRTNTTVDQLDPGEYDRSFEVYEENWELNRRIRLALSKLGPACRDLLLAFYFEEKSMKTIANERGQQPASVKNGKYRCIQKLKKILKNKPASWIRNA